MFQSPLDYNTLYFYAKHTYGKEKAIPFIQSMDVEWVDKNKIKIHVYEKPIIGCVEYLGSYMYFNREGVVVEAAKEALDNIPYITGIEFNRIMLYEKLEVPKEELFHVILNLSLLSDKYELNVDRIEFNKYYEATLVKDNIRIILGKKDRYDDLIAYVSEPILLMIAEKKTGIFDLTNYKLGQKLSFVEKLNEVEEEAIKFESTAYLSKSVKIGEEVTEEIIKLKKNNKRNTSIKMSLEVEEDKKNYLLVREDNRIFLNHHVLSEREDNIIVLKLIFSKGGKKAVRRVTIEIEQQESTG